MTSSNHIFATVVTCITAALFCAASTADESSHSPDQLHFFETHIRPLLHAKCVKCHGESQQKGELRLDSLENLLQGGESGPAAVANPLGCGDVKRPRPRSLNPQSTLSTSAR